MKRPKTATVNLKVRMKEPLRAKVETSAKKRGVSLNAEVVKRIELSFEAEKRESLIASQATGGLYGSFGSIESFMVMRLLAHAISTMELTSGRKWREDSALFAEVKKACGQILNFFKPGDEGQPPSISNELLTLGVIASESENLGHKAAAQVMEAWLDRIQFVQALRGPAARKKTKPE